MHKGPVSHCGDDLFDLISATARHDQKAFAQLYAATSSKLYGVALRVLRRRDLAEEVVQEAYLASCGPLRPGARFADHLDGVDRPPPGDRQGPKPRRPDPGKRGRSPRVSSADTPHPLDEMTLSEKRHRAFTAMRDLDPVKRRLVIAAYLHGESREQLARRFGAPVNTIKTWLRRAVLELRAGLEEDEAHRVA